MKKAIPITALFLDIGGVLHTRFSAGPVIKEIPAPR
jgi:hypothetical protein